MRPHVLHGDPGGDFFWVVGPPDPRLVPFVRSYQDFHERTGGPLTRLEIPSGDLALIVNFGDGWTVGQGETAPTRMGSFAGGLHDGPATAGHDGAARCMELTLTPLGARALLGVPAIALSHRCVPLEALLGLDAERLADELEALGDWRARFERLDALLMRRAATVDPLRPDVAFALRRLRATGGAARVEAVAAELRCSRRHLSVRFREQVGLSPKAYARVLRFDRAARLLRDGADIADAALATGYADQPHFTRDFRAMTGTTPTAYLDARLGVAGVAA